MTRGFLLITVKTGEEKAVSNRLKRLKEVKHVNILFSEWDLIAELEVEDFGGIAPFISEEIRNIPGIIDLKTLTCIKE